MSDATIKMDGTVKTTPQQFTTVCMEYTLLGERKQITYTPKLNHLDDVEMAYKSMIAAKKFAREALFNAAESLKVVVVEQE